MLKTALLVVARGRISTDDLIMEDDLKQQLLALARRDDQMREQLIQKGVLFGGGYHSEMQRVHNENADALELILQTVGWPSEAIVSRDGQAAAWLVVQHAVAKPDFQKRCLSLIKQAAANHVAQLAHVAYLEDRIRFFEGRPQIYGTQFDWDDNGDLSPYEIENIEKVDHLRNKMGLGALQEAIMEMRDRAFKEGNNAPTDLQSRRKQFIEWAKKTGWRT